MHVSLRKSRGGSRIQTWNRYAYVGNNPLNAIDPKGLYIACDYNGDSSCDDGGGAGGGGGGGGGGGQISGGPCGAYCTPLPGLISPGQVPQWYLDQVNNGQANLAHPGAPGGSTPQADYTIWVTCTGEDVASYSCAPAPWSSKYFAPGSGTIYVGWAGVAAMLNNVYRMAAGPVKGAAVATMAVAGGALIGAEVAAAGCPTHSRVSNEWASGITRLRVFHHRPHI